MATPIIEQPLLWDGTPFATPCDGERNVEAKPAVLAMGQAATLRVEFFDRAAFSHVMPSGADSAVSWRFELRDKPGVDFTVLFATSDVTQDEKHIDVAAANTLTEELEAALGERASGVFPAMLSGFDENNDRVFTACFPLCVANTTDSEAVPEGADSLTKQIKDLDGRVTELEEHQQDVDDVLFFDTKENPASGQTAFPLYGEDGKIYGAKDTGRLYRWDADGNEYVIVGGDTPVAPSTSASDAGKPADAKATGDALAGKVSKTGDTMTGPLVVSDGDSGDRATYLHNKIRKKFGTLSVDISLPSSGGVIAIQNAIATKFSNQSTYEVGEYCVNEGLLYKCSTAVSTAGEWNASNWTVVTVLELLAGKASTADATLVPLYPSDEYAEFDFYDGGVLIPASEGYSATVSRFEEAGAVVSVGTLYKNGSQVSYTTVSGIARSFDFYIESTDSFCTAVQRATGLVLGSQTDKPLAPATLKEYVDSELEGKQNVLTFDAAPTENSDNPVKSGGIKTAIDDKIGYLNNNDSSYASPDASGRIVLIGGKFQAFRSTDFQNPNNIEVVRDSGSGNVGKLAVVGVRAIGNSVSVWGVPLASGDYVFRIYNIGTSLNQLISQYPTPPDTNYVQKSQTAGLLKNDGTVDTNTYLTTAPVTSVNGQTGAVTLAIPDISGKLDATKRNLLDYTSGTTLAPETAVYRSSLNADGTFPAITDTAIPTAAAYYQFELELAVPSTVPSTITGPSGWTWLDGHGLPDPADLVGGETICISVRLDCTARTFLASVWRVA